MLQNLRIDKYLWAVRVFKTRSIATDECKKGHVIINDIQVKPSRTIKPGDIIYVKAPPIIRTFQVVDLLERRVSAIIAKDFVVETTPESEFIKLKLAKNTFVVHEKGSGRPTKKSRRLIEKFKDDEK